MQKTSLKFHYKYVYLLNQEESEQERAWFMKIGIIGPKKTLFVIYEVVPGDDG